MTPDHTNSNDFNSTGPRNPRNPRNPRHVRPDALTEAELGALLDEALASGAGSGGIPAGLNERILAATLPVLGQEPPVLARIGVRRWASVVAAELVIGASLGIVLTLGSMFQQAHAMVALRGDLNAAVQRAALVANEVTTTTAGSAERVEATARVDPVSLLSDLERVQHDLDKGLRATDNNREQNDNALVF